MILRRILFSLLLSSLAWAQQSVLRHIITNANASTVSPVVQNIGQSAHQATLYINCMGGTWSGSGQFEYSYDGVVFSAFGTPQIDVPLMCANQPAQAYQFFATGVFNLVRFRVVFGTCSGTCTVNVWYSGSQSPAAATQVYGVFPNGATIGPSTQVNPVLVGGTSSRDTLSSIINCSIFLNQPASQTVTAGTSLRLVTGSAAFPNAYICGGIVTLAMTGTVQFLAGSGTNCGTATMNLTPAFTLAAGFPLTIQTALGAGMLVASGGADICVAATGGNAAVYLVYSQQ